jgi:hypothetical protein
MSARQSESSALCEHPAAGLAAARLAGPLHLPVEAVRVRRNGIEFHHAQPLAPWTEVLVRVSHSGREEPVPCTGVVVACTGSPRTGYCISVVLIGLPPQSERTLAALAHSQLS